MATPSGTSHLSYCSCSWGPSSPTHFASAHCQDLSGATPQAWALWLYCENWPAALQPRRHDHAVPSLLLCVLGP